jgi:hypothetical protein
VQRNIIDNFIHNIGSTSYWNIVLGYSYNGQQPATPATGAIWSTGCINNANYGLTGCSVAEYNEQGILNYGLDNGFIPKGKWAIFSIFGGTDVTYTSTAGGRTFVMGNSALCGTHGVSVFFLQIGHQNS